MKTKRRSTDTEDDRGCPESWAALAKAAEKETRWTDAARLWDRASGVTIGHSRGDMYNTNERLAYRKAAEQLKKA